MGIARELRCACVFRFLSATRIDHDYDTASSNNNKVNPGPYEPRRDAEVSDGNGLTDTLKSYSQSRPETFGVALCASCSTRLKRAVNSNHLAEAILSDSGQ